MTSSPISWQAGEDKASAMWIVGFIFTMVTGGKRHHDGPTRRGPPQLLTERPRPTSALLLDDPALIRPAVDEFLRLTSPVQNLARTTTRPVELHGQTIPADRKVMLLYGAANRDDREFGTAAEALDVNRNIDKMLSLGYGPHHCLGASAARLQSAVALERLLDWFPNFAVDLGSVSYAPGPYVRRHDKLAMTTNV